MLVLQSLHFFSTAAGAAIKQVIFFWFRALDRRAVDAHPKLHLLLLVQVPGSDLSGLNPGLSRRQNKIRRLQLWGRLLVLRSFDGGLLLRLAVTQLVFVFFLTARHY